MNTAAQTARPGGPTVGLPEGVFLAPVGRRFVAFLIDAFLPYLFIAAGFTIIGLGGPGWLAVILFVLPVLWALVLWWMYAMLAAGPGMRLMRLQLVGLHDGRPIGFLRSLLRAVLLWLISSFSFLLIIMAILMLMQTRRQGWHDMAVDSVVIDERPLAPPRPGEVRDPRRWVHRLLSRSGSTKPDLGGPPQVTGTAPRPAIEAGPAAEGISLMDEPADHAQTEPARPEPEPQPSPEPQPAATATQQPVVPPPNVGWYAVLDDGREVPITRLTLFGRNPQPRPGEGDAQLIKVVDEARTVSKTHLALNVDSRGVFVIDRGSTNGSAVTDPYGVYNLITADQPVRLSGEGYVVSFGNHHLRLARH
jgi:uncharacterized RDD family membrane protein YckC